MKVKAGDRVAIMREGTFKTHTGKEFTTTPGQRGRVVQLESRSAHKKKIWALVEVYDAKGRIIARTHIPGWWLEPKSVLDDLAEV